MVLKSKELEYLPIYDIFELKGGCIIDNINFN